MLVVFVAAVVYVPLRSETAVPVRVGSIPLLRAWFRRRSSSSHMATSKFPTLWKPTLSCAAASMRYSTTRAWWMQLDGGSGVAGAYGRAASRMD